MNAERNGKREEHGQPMQWTFLREQGFLKRSLTDLIFGIHLS